MDQTGIMWISGNYIHKEDKSRQAKSSKQNILEITPTKTPGKRNSEERKELQDDYI